MYIQYTHTLYCIPLSRPCFLVLNLNPSVDLKLGSETSRVEPWEDNQQTVRKKHGFKTLHDIWNIYIMIINIYIYIHTGMFFF